MAGTIKFKCLKCGECCKNLHIKTKLGGAKWVTLGLFILPHERKLFPANIVMPMYGAGIKGKSRPRPDIIFAYQISQNICPHLTSKNLCGIYKRRPIACRSFPLETVFLDRRCTWVKQRFYEGEGTPRDMLDLGNMSKYHKMLFKHITAFAEGYHYMWAWNLNTKKWVKTRW